MPVGKMHALKLTILKCLERGNSLVRIMRCELDVLETMSHLYEQNKSTSTRVMVLVI
jgi:hypothetical protein